MKHDPNETADTRGKGIGGDHEDERRASALNKRYAKPHRLASVPPIIARHFGLSADGGAA